MAALNAIILRDLRLAWRANTGAVLVLVFFVLTVSLFPLGLGPAPNLLARIAPGILWVAALLSCLLSLDRLFQADLEDGSLEQMLLASPMLELTVLAKVVAHWLTSGLPLVLIAPLLGLLLQLPAEAFGTLFLAMLLGTPILSLIGAMGASLTLGLRRGGPLLALLVLPLYIPLLIFAASAVDVAATGQSPFLPLAVISAILLASVALCPWASAAALRLNLN